MALLCAIAGLFGSPSPLLGAQDGGTRQLRAPYQAAIRALNEGRYDQVEALTEALDSADPMVAALRARAAVARGRYAAAEGLLRQPATQYPTSDAALELALLHVTLGRRAEAAPVLERIVDAVPTAGEPADLARAARAARALGHFQEANGYFREAAAEAPDDPAINTEWGELFLEKYNRQDGARSFQAALRRDPRWAPAQLGLARAVADENPPAAMSLAEKALGINPSYVAAHLFVAGLALDEGHRDQARTSIARALEINASSLEARALLAAIAKLEGREADFRAEVARALAINPLYGEVYRVAGDLAARNYRFDEAVALARQAIALDPDDNHALADLGIHLLRSGDESAARTALDRAFRADPYDVVTYNLLGLLDTLEKFQTVRDGDLILRMHPDEAAVLGEYAVPLARQALRTLSAKYQFEPKGPILIEIFPRHDDFAVRNVGLPGMIGALGACFGRVVTMDSPRARPPGTFSWGATLWHELAHVITLQMSNQRVPRWLTEGISVYEEKRARPEWGREMELVFAQVLERGEALKLRDLNAGFTNPETISLAYYEASLLVEHLVAAYGDAGIRKLLRAYGQGLETEAALLQGLGVTIDRLQVGFNEALEKSFGGLRRAMRAPEAFGGSAPLETLKTLAASNPDSYPVQLALGQALVKAGDLDAALAALERAAALVPVASGAESPRALMAGIALKKGDRLRAARELEALLAHDHTNVDAARRLVELLDPAADAARLATALERVVALDPFETAPHTTLGRLAMQRKDADTAAREFRVALAAGPVDRAAALCDLAESSVLGGKLLEAKKQTLAALEIAPTYERAQELLLKLAEGRP